MGKFAPESIAAASAETERLQRELNITNADHIALWLESNMADSPLGWLACRIIEAHESAAEARAEWQPIDTAPKDGSGILLVDVNCLSPQAGMGWWIEDKWQCDDPENIRGADDIISWWTDPTHWMPLPAPPAAAHNAGEGR